MREKTTYLFLVRNGDCRITFAQSAGPLLERGWEIEAEGSYPEMVVARQNWVSAAGV